MTIERGAKVRYGLFTGTVVEMEGHIVLINRDGSRATDRVPVWLLRKSDPAA